eukprot:TRINITY_DN17515_c0_g1_i1.p1 TRINITY_DN17515_c0_g1~~TRINITY_DN17515_c0_g1_i1.p1  ORF type:complete len:921 (+),score=196.81 TRINITY_DN17515_c0_g1_i1:101-2863(+)
MAAPLASWDAPASASTEVAAARAVRDLTSSLEAVSAVLRRLQATTADVGDRIASNGTSSAAGGLFGSGVNASAPGESNTLVPGGSVASAAAGDLPREEDVGLVAMAFAGAVLAGLALWLMLANGPRIGAAMRAALEQRVAVCCVLNTYVAVVSAALTLLQLTGLDDVPVERSVSFTANLAQPIEWILTFPVMQLVIVVLGGPRLPDGRRLLLPGLAASAFGCIGLGALLVWGAARWVLYGVGLSLALMMWCVNAKQILEHSSGREGITSGASSFRKASLLLIATSVPFPLWFLLSPAGCGLIDNVVATQVGWSILNACSKLAFIFYIQRAKDWLHVVSEVSVTDLYCINIGEPSKPDVHCGPGKLELDSTVAKCLAALGMGQHSEHVFRLLECAEIKSLADLDALSKERCKDLQLSHDLVYALQVRRRTWSDQMREQTVRDMEACYAQAGAGRPSGASALSSAESLECVTAKPRHDADDQLCPETPDTEVSCGGDGGVDAVDASLTHLLNTRMDTLEDVLAKVLQLSESNVSAAQAALAGQDSLRDDALERASSQGRQASELDGFMRASVARLEKLVQTSVEQLESSVLAGIKSLDVASHGTLAAAQAARVSAQSAHQTIVQASQAAQASQERIIQEMQASQESIIQATQVATQSHLLHVKESVAEACSNSEKSVQVSQEKIVQTIEMAAHSQLLQLKECVADACATTGKSIDVVGKSVQVESERIQEVSAEVSAKVSAKVSAQVEAAVSDTRSALETLLQQELQRLNEAEGERSRIGLERTDNIGDTLKRDIGALVGRSDAQIAALREGREAHKDGLAELQRLVLHVLQQVHESSESSKQEMTEVHRTVETSAMRVISTVSQLSQAMCSPTASVTTPLLQSQTWSMRPNGCLGQFEATSGGSRLRLESDASCGGGGVGG